MNSIFRKLAGLGGTKLDRSKMYYPRAKRSWKKLHALAEELGCSIEDATVRPSCKNYYIIVKATGERPQCLDSMTNFDNAHEVEGALETIKKEGV
ncbi:MAG TPA: hypothetical protein VJ044_19265 [Candidatus Hodarchaeales archaeon]|nr:hypothetical protein [Candidatus Hodarchaeales archaeon]